MAEKYSTNIQLTRSIKYSYNELELFLISLIHKTFHINYIYDTPVELLESIYSVDSIKSIDKFYEIYLPVFQAIYSLRRKYKALEYDSENELNIKKYAIFIKYYPSWHYATLLINRKL